MANVPGAQAQSIDELIDSIALLRADVTAKDSVLCGSAHTLPLAAAHRVRLIVVLAVADLSALLAVGLTLMTEMSFAQRWAIWLAVFVAVACIHGASHAVGLYHAHTPASLYRSARLLLVLGVPNVIGLALVAHGIDPKETVVPVGSLAGAALVGCMIVRLAVAAWTGRNAAQVIERVVLAGTDEAVAAVLKRASAASHPERIAGWIAVRTASPAAGKAPVPPMARLDPTSGSLATIAEDAYRIGGLLHACKPRVGRLVIVSTDLDELAIATLLTRLEQIACEIALLPPGAAMSESADLLGSDNCVVLRRAAMGHWSLVGKRLLDFAAATLLLIVLAPIILTIAALVRITSPGPALFRQTRAGLNNVPFTVFKFRTMWNHAAATDGSVQATQGDRRITPIGGFLRRTSLDELPQLLNVLNGTMSLVGPRPHPVELNRRYLGIIERYSGRHRVHPGITGLAQVNGLRGETSSPSAMRRRVECDLEYIRTRSLVMDIRILLKTVVSVVRGGNAY